MYHKRHIFDAYDNCLCVGKSHSSDFLLPYVAETPGNELGHAGNKTKEFTRSSQANVVGAMTKN